MEDGLVLDGRLEKDDPEVVGHGLVVEDACNDAQEEAAVDTVDDTDGFGHSPCDGEVGVDGHP